jgi:arylsulfatase A-like enzyme
MKGGEAARWIDEDMADTFLAEAKHFVKSNKSEPFFLYYALQQPHVPRTPHSRFVGATGLGPRGDAIAEADWCIGEILKTLQEEGLLENTLVILSSDNGPVLNDGYEDQAVELNGSHSPWGPLRGGKYSLFQAGTRVPFIVSWPGTITPGVTHALVSQVDLLASLGKLTGAEVKNTDSQDLADVLLGKTKQGRKNVILEAMGRTAYREGDWVLIPPYEGPAIQANVNIELGNDAAYQLYNLKEDVGETKNLAFLVPEKLDQMIAAYQKILSSD